MATRSVITLRRAFEILAEGDDPRDVVTHTLNQLGIKHRFEPGGRHMFVHYEVNGQQHKFTISHGHIKGKGHMRDNIKTFVRRHVRAAQSGQNPGWGH